jgi:hypothetical protein
MKNKKNIYILVPAVLLVWSILGYRLFSTIKPTVNAQQTTTAIVQFKATTLQENTQFTINTNYRDPFLGKLPKKQAIKSKKVQKSIVKMPKIPFPTITYKGLVSGKKNKSQVFLIAINGQQYFFKKNTSHNTVKLIRGTTKEVILTFQGQQQIFPIEK